MPQECHKHSLSPPTERVALHRWYALTVRAAPFSSSGSYRTQPGQLRPTCSCPQMDGVFIWRRASVPDPEPSGRGWRCSTRPRCAQKLLPTCPTGFVTLGRLQGPLWPSHQTGAGCSPIATTIMLPATRTTGLSYSTLRQWLSNIRRPTSTTVALRGWPHRTGPFSSSAIAQPGLYLVHLRPCISSTQ